VSGQEKREIASEDLPLPCFHCGGKLEVAFSRPQGPAFSDEERRLVPPFPALEFRALGNFGSTVFDPAGMSLFSWLTINICDQCILGFSARVALMVQDPPQPYREVKIYEFDPENVK
jgi:hypothetical protein